jgi:hypothetical protein
MGIARGVAFFWFELLGEKKVVSFTGGHKRKSGLRLMRTSVSLEFAPRAYGRGKGVSSQYGAISNWYKSVAKREGPGVAVLGYSMVYLWKLAQSLSFPKHQFPHLENEA